MTLDLRLGNTPGIHRLSICFVPPSADAGIEPYRVASRGEGHTKCNVSKWLLLNANLTSLCEAQTVTTLEPEVLGQIDGIL